MQYTQDYDEKMPLRRFAHVAVGGAYSSSDTNAGDSDQNSWRTVVQPYIKSTQLFICPSNPDKEKATYDPEFNRSYAANVSADKGVFSNATPILLADIEKPASVIAVAEIFRVPYVSFYIDYTFPAPYDDTGTGGPSGIRHYGDALFTGHNGTSNYLFADGHVKALRPLQTIRDTNMWYRDNSTISAQGQASLEIAQSRES